MQVRVLDAYHPFVELVFFTGAIVLCAFVRHPILLAVQGVCAVLCLLLLQGRAALPLVGTALLAFVVLTFLNPLFNTMGETVIGTYLGGRPYTLEALLFGMMTGAMLATMLLWFACLNAVMTTDRLLCVFGKIAPAVATVLTLTFRLISSYRIEAVRVENARYGMGKSPRTGDMRDRLGAAAAMFSTIGGKAFEDAVTTADSMKSRGFGLPGRTSYARYQFLWRDVVAILLVAVCLCVVGVCLGVGAASVEFFPMVVLAPVTPIMVVGIVAYALLLALPSLAIAGGEASWRWSLSRI